MKNILIHIPHSSYFIPNKFKELFYLTDDELLAEQLKMTDSYTDELFNIPETQKIICPVSRLVCDVERFRNKNEEEMTTQGMWVCYIKTSNLKLLKKVNKTHENEILSNYYDKHHNNFNQQVTSILNKQNICLIIDAHSFPSKPLPYELYSQKHRPDICLGIDDYHTPKYLAEYFYKYFTDLGYNTLINSPFKGTIVPLNYYQKNKKVISIMLEINRSLYMDEVTGQKNHNFNKVKKDIFNSIKYLNCISTSVKSSKPSNQNKHITTRHSYN